MDARNPFCFERSLNAAENRRGASDDVFLASQSEQTSQHPPDLGPTLSIFGPVLWPQGLQIGLPNLMVPALGPIQGHKVQHLLITWGQIEKKNL
jgi:hypothetical protein